LFSQDGLITRERLVPLDPKNLWLSFLSSDQCRFLDHWVDFPQTSRHKCSLSLLYFHLYIPSKLQFRIFYLCKIDLSIFKLASFLHLYHVSNPDNTTHCKNSYFPGSYMYLSLLRPLFRNSLSMCLHCSMWISQTHAFHHWHILPHMYLYCSPLCHDHEGFTLSIRLRI